ncbi:MAG TPA: glycosyltransferase family 1 protein, partial [Candidatus Dormibacteraeota bacterium]|nr:glycosyltransferase family 1 protein [Candidatus Dormibacteraeota bacterium]
MTVTFLCPAASTVAVDINPAVRRSITGTELYAREVCERLPDLLPDVVWRFYCSRPGPLRIDATVLPFRRLWSQVRLPIELNRRPPELFFAPSHVIPFAISAPSLTVVHDLAFERFPEAYPPSDRAYLRLTTKWAVRRCRLLITVSESTARDLRQIYAVPPERIRVVHPGGGDGLAEGPDPGLELSSATLRSLGIEGPYVLQVGRIEARKNPLTGLRAVETAGGMTYVSIGRETDSAIAAEIRKSPRSRVLGHVDGSTKRVLYRHASAFICTSLYEGFGFPLLEAMRAGTPVVTAANSSLGEIAADAALLVEDARNIV